ncbi:MAG: TlpA disulfide reductase family protein [Pseudomonadota bacterium]
MIKYFKISLPWSIPILALLLMSCSGDGGKIAGVLPDIVLPDIKGKPVRLMDLKGRVILLNFWATWCPPCQREIPDFIQLQKELGPKGLTIVGISLDQDKDLEQVAEYSLDMKINYLVLYAGQRQKEIAEKMGGFRGIPTSFLVDRSGRVVVKHLGLAPLGAWKEEIEKLL